MAQEQNKNTIVVPITTGDLNDITLTTFDEATDVIQQLDDEPNDVGGLTAEQLKAKFDQVGTAFKTYINGTLIPEVIGAHATEQERQANEAQRILNELGRVSAENARSVFENFDAAKAYSVGNKVSYLGSSYRCIANTTAGILPTDTTYWLLIAEKGNTGPSGVDTATATVDGTSLVTPTVSVNLDTTTKNLAFAFSGLKGNKGDKGDTGNPGTNGKVTDVYKISSGTRSSFLDGNNEANLSEITTAIDNLKSIGRFLSLWNAETGLPQSEPVGGTPYTYKIGDYYRVGTVGTGTNYKPSGASYTGAASTDVETESVEVGWVYYYDGTQWLTQSSGGGSVTDVQLGGTSIVDAGTGIANVQSIPYTTTEPTSAYSGVGLKLAVLDSAPSSYYQGWLYYIKE